MCDLNNSPRLVLDSKVLSFLFPSGVVIVRLRSYCNLRASHTPLLVLSGIFLDKLT